MFCAFEGSPKIVRLHGKGEVHEPSSKTYPSLLHLFPPRDGVRSVIKISVTRIADSCGWGVPLMDFKAKRTQHPEFCEKMGPEKLAKIQAEYNTASIDGLTGLQL